MKFLDNVKARFAAFRQKIQEKNKNEGKGSTFRYICHWVYKLRSVFMAIPVLIAAFWLASYNSEHLPLLVGLNLQSTGEFARTALFAILLVSFVALFLYHLYPQVLYSNKSMLLLVNANASYSGAISRMAAPSLL